MSNHLHMIISSKDGIILASIMRDFKKFTSKKIISLIKNDGIESRRNWILDRFELAGKKLNRIKNYKVWKDGNHPEELYSNKFIQQKLNYIHNNPVTAEIVDEPEHYLYSSARDYIGEKGLIDIILID